MFPISLPKFAKNKFFQCAFLLGYGDEALESTEFIKNNVENSMKILNYFGNSKGNFAILIVFKSSSLLFENWSKI